MRSGWIIVFTTLVCGGAHAACPTDDASRHISISGVGEGERVRRATKLDLRIDSHDFDSVQVGVNAKTMLRVEARALTDLDGSTDSGLTLQIGPRRSPAPVIPLIDGNQSFWVRTFKGTACKSEKVLSISGGDSRVSALVVGIEDYEFATDLDYAEDDAVKFAELLKVRVPVAELNLKTMFGPEATKEAIMVWVQDTAETVSETGTFLVYFSGHGTLYWNKNNNQISAYFVPQDAQPSRPNMMIAHKEIGDWIGDSPAARRILISDSCFSGASLKPNPIAAPRGGKAKSLMDPTALDFINRARDSIANWNTVNINLTWFSSSQGNEVSYELKDLGGGVFTHYVLKDLKTDTSYSSAKKKTIDEIAAAHPGMQTPQLFSSNSEMIFPLEGGGGS